jgi:hypothetical protein
VPESGLAEPSAKLASTLPGHPPVVTPATLRPHSGRHQK